jgi:hypothetical protein
MRLPIPLLVLLGCALLAVAACTGGDQERTDAAEGAAPLGPADGRELPPSELERVSIGDAAPDFRLESLRRGVVALSDYRGEKDVVLVFYRGHW